MGPGLTRAVYSWAGLRSGFSVADLVSVRSVNRCPHLPDGGRLRYRWKRSGTRTRERPRPRTGVSKTPFGRWGQRFTMDYLADRKLSLTKWGFDPWFGYYSIFFH